MNNFALLALFLALAGPAMSQADCPSFCYPDPNGLAQAQAECNQILFQDCHIENCLRGGGQGFMCTKAPRSVVIVSNTVFDTDSADLRLDYTWSPNQTDLDTATAFLDNISGRQDVCGLSGPYMQYSGDDTGMGGRESTIVDLELARRDSSWNILTSVEARAIWTGLLNQGEARLTVYLRDRATDSAIPGTGIAMAIRPRPGSGCADTPVGVVLISRGPLDTHLTLFPGQ